MQLRKNVIFIFTHTGSDYQEIVNVLNKNPNIEVFQTGNQYHHPDDLQQLTKLPHKKNNSASVWADVLFYNEQFTCRSLYNYCKFIFWANDLDNKDLYYRFRLNCMKQYYKRTNGLWNPSLVEKDLLFDSILG